MTDLPNFNLEEAQIFKDIATSQHDHPVFMLNLNRYKNEADYPSGRIYKSYMKVLDKSRFSKSWKIKNNIWKWWDCRDSSIHVI